MKQSNISTEDLKNKYWKLVKNANDPFKYTMMIGGHNRIRLSMFNMVESEAKDLSVFIESAPSLAKEVIELREENERLKKQVDNFYNELKNTFQ